MANIDEKYKAFRAKQARELYHFKKEIGLCVHPTCSRVTENAVRCEKHLASVNYHASKAPSQLKQQHQTRLKHLRSCAHKDCPLCEVYNRQEKEYNHENK